jgi:hypothetical protein
MTAPVDKDGGVSWHRDRVRAPPILPARRQRCTNLPTRADFRRAIVIANFRGTLAQAGNHRVPVSVVGGQLGSEAKGKSLVRSDQTVAAAFEVRDANFCHSPHSPHWDFGIP